MKRAKTGFVDRNGKMIRAGDIVDYVGTPLVVVWGYYPGDKSWQWVALSSNLEVYSKSSSGKKVGAGMFFGGVGTLGPNCYGVLPEIIGNIYKR